jgi:hypothetical protein
MKNIQAIDAPTTAHTTFLLPPMRVRPYLSPGQNVAFIDEVIARGPRAELDAAFARIWKRAVQKAEALGIHGILFFSSWSTRSGTTRPAGMQML